MPSPRSQNSRRAVDVLLNAGLAASRRGVLGELPSRHRRLSQMLDRWLGPMLSTVGDGLPATDRVPLVVKTLLVWGLSQLRPDRKSGLGDIDEHAWLHSTSWRPLLAIACHHGLLTIPPFPSRYRRNPQEGAIDNLCGLWAVGPSTLYRYLDKGRRRLADVYLSPWPTGDQLVGMRWAAESVLLAGPEPGQGWPTWRRRQAAEAFRSGSVANGLWHLQRAGDLDGLIDALDRHSAEAANSPETDVLFGAFDVQSSMSMEQQFELAIRFSRIWCHRHDGEREEESLRLALKLANDIGAPLYLGIGYAWLARFHELRDGDRAFAEYEACVEHLRRAIETKAGDLQQRAVREYTVSIIRLAWLQLRRNNPRAKDLLDQVQALSAQFQLDADVVGSLEQTWGEYWRCKGELSRALEHKHRALLAFERVGDQRSVLNTYRNLSLIYGETRDFARALDYGQRVVDAAKGLTLEPELLAGAHGNMGIAYFYQEDFDQAIREYSETLRIQEAAGLRAHIGAAHYNLAETYYRRFQKHADPEDERRGDWHAATAARVSAEDNVPGLKESARSLKREILGAGESPDRLIPAEYAAHFEEMAEIQRLRTGLAIPQAPEQQARTHLAIARAYLAIVTKEREAALAIAARHGVDEDFGPELNALRQTFERELTKEQQWETRWQQQASELLQPEQRSAALNRLITMGAINKSAYAEVCGVSLATASKHLGLLADRGLLVQTGKGPSTRYLLPDSLN